MARGMGHKFMDFTTEYGKALGISLPREFHLAIAMAIASLSCYTHATFRDLFAGHDVSLPDCQLGQICMACN